MYLKYFHTPKSSYAYMASKETLHIWLKTAKDVKNVSLLFGDPFNYEPIDETLKEWQWVNETKTTIMEKKLEDSYFNYFFIEIKPPFKRVKYAFLIDNETLYGQREIIKLSNNDKKKYHLFNYFNFPYLNEDDLISTPEWTKNTIWYQIFPDRFKRADNSTNYINSPWLNKDQPVTNDLVLGGNLKGIIKSLDYLEDLGITGLYLTPIFKSPSTHKYDTTDYFEIDEQFGTKEDLRMLVKEAHKRDIKVVLDAVFNHSGFLHPFFKDVLKYGKNSKYYECFHIKKEPIINFELTEKGTPKYTRGLKPNYETFAFASSMPKWNTNSKITRDYLIDVATYYIKEFDIDGWRLDVANEVSHSFWRLFRSKVKEIKPDAYIFGENWDFANSWLMGDQFDGVMNYEFTYPLWQFLDNFGSIDQINASEFRRIINNLLTSYPVQITESMFNLVECHDTERVINRASGNLDLTFLYYLLMFSFPGSPNIYYGGELALAGKGDPDSRRAMPWNDGDYNFRNKLKWLINLRKNEKAFGSSNFKFIYTDDATNVIGYQTKKDNETITIFINPSSKNVLVNYKISGYDLVTNKTINTSSFNLDSYNFLLIKTTL